MTAPVWQPGFLYQPGDLVRPASAPAASSAVIPNAGFESGDVSWTKTNVTIVNEAGSYAGDWHAKFVYAGGASGFVAMSTPVAVKPGQSITASCYIRATGPDQVGGDINIVWLDAAQALISVSQGNEVNTSNGQAWKKSSVTASAPANAAYCYLQGDAFALQANGVVRFDQFSWNYVPPVDSTLIYKAVQAEAGFSDSSEPAWPGVLGQQVIDNEVIWEAVNTSRVVWEASPILKSGTVEPTWPTEPGAFVADGSISWECVSRHVEQAPRSKVVVIAAKKVFAADRDIVRFSATVNPLDWTSENDAGYLPTGLQSGNANEMKVLNRYRNNVVAMNANGFQMWQVDPDPALMALLDEKPGVGSSWQHAAQPVSNELLYLSQRGVRSIGIAAASENLSAGDVGDPIDPLVMEALNEAIANDRIPISTYYPGQGQYWLTFTDFPEDEMVSYLVAGGVTPRVMSVYEIDAGIAERQTDSPDTQPVRISAAEYSTDGEYLATASWGASPYGAAYRREGGTFTKLSFAGPGVSSDSLSWSPDGLLAYAGSTTKVYRNADGVFSEIWSQSNAGRSVAFSPDGSLLVCGRGSSPNYFLDVYSVSGDTITLENSYALPGGPTYDLAFSADGGRLVASSSGTTACRVYTVAGNALTFVTTIGTGTVNSARFNAAGDRLAIGSATSSEQGVYETTTFTRVAGPLSPYQLLSVNWGHGDELLAVGGFEDTGVAAAKLFAVDGDTYTAITLSDPPTEDCDAVAIYTDRVRQSP